MQKLVASIACFSLCAVLATAQDDKGKAEFRIDRGLGTWDVTSNIAFGKKIPNDLIANLKMVFAFNEGNYCLTSAGPGSGPEFGTYTIDAKKEPAQIELVATTGRDKGKTRLGLIKIVGDDVMTLAMSKAGGKNRPKDFDGSDSDVMVLKARVSPFLKDKGLFGTAGDNAKNIVGVWEVTKKEGPMPPDGAFFYEVTKAGKFTITIRGKDDKKAVLVGDGSYKVEGDKLTITTKSGEKEVTHTETIKKLTDTELITEDDKGKVTEFKRVK